MATNKIDDLIVLGERLCERLRDLTSELVNTPELPDERQKTILLWRILLLGLSSDVGSSVIRLAQLKHENHARAMRMLDRSLFEYGLRLEFYVFCPEHAIKHAENFRTWWGVLLKSSQAFMDVRMLTKEERRYINEIVKEMDTLDIPAIRYMLLRVLTMNGYVGAERKRLTKWLLGNYYHIGSALIHGSQGAFADFFGKNPTTGVIAYTAKSVRHAVGDTLFNSVLHLIEVLSSEEKHRKADLASDMYYRDLELASGRWGILEALRTHGNFLAPQA